MATKTREKKKVIAGVTLQQAQEASSWYAYFHNQQRQLEAEMNEKINRIRDAYQDELTRLAEQKAEQFEVLQSFAREQKDSWKNKSLELLHTVIGFRIGNPKVVKDKKFTWDAVTELALKYAPGFVRTRYELDKEAIIASRESPEMEALRNNCYVDVVQDETFYVEVKEETVNER